MRIAGANIPDNKHLETALSYLYGIGVPLAQKILDNINIPRNKKAKDLMPAEAARLREAVEKYPVEGELRREIMMNIKRLRDIKCYRGLRLREGIARKRSADKNQFADAKRQCQKNCRQRKKEIRKDIKFGTWAKSES